MNLKFIFCILIFTLIFGCKEEKKTSFKDAEISKNNKPNIIIIIVDDAGYIDFGFMGSEDLETPRLDKLAKNGVVFTDAHVSATVCAPSRAGLITGKYQQRFGFEANGTGGIGLADDVITIADVFKKNNYKTIALGKWHLGESESDHPNKRGFDDFYGFIGGSRSYFPLEKPSKQSLLQHNGERIIFKGYLTDVLGDESASYVEENQDEPFFMYLAYNAPHTPMHAKEVHLEKYKDHPRKKLAAMTWSLDENIGKLVDKLEETDQLENTLIFFLSDNGGSPHNTSDNGILKGWKGNKFEGGHRVPFVVHWGKEIKGNQTFNGLTSSLDIFTTSIAAAGIKNTFDLDGTNLIPFLKGEQTGNPHEKLFWRKLNEAGARIGEKKLVRLKDYGSTYYDLKSDLGEMYDLTNTDLKTSDFLHKELELWESTLITPLWDEGDWMPVTYHIQQRLMQNKQLLYNTPGSRKKYLKNNLKRVNKRYD
ncbi:sulfatase-like hydrolase/transferase [Wocania ichthyoenteri]|uniref:sulfatase-like hydrolase/transferase n=1 Tax=Wocania ichthyoenteri TaxID=1230531 RepID=UPI00068AB561|nr:sulfatase-like hydrolase/transferase [Wocania ichthyoenteri]